jgi:hypothetical protein
VRPYISMYAFFGHVPVRCVSSRSPADASTAGRMPWRRSQDESDDAFTHEFGKTRPDASQAIEYHVGETGHLEHRGLGFGPRAGRAEEGEQSDHEMSMDSLAEQPVTACVAMASQSCSLPLAKELRHHHQRSLHHVSLGSLSESEEDSGQVREVLCAPLSGCHSAGLKRAARTSVARAIVSAKRAARAAQRRFDPVAVRDDLLTMAEDPNQRSAHSVLCGDSGAAAWVQHAASLCGLSSGTSGRARALLVTVNRTCQARRLSSDTRVRLDSWVSQAVESLLQHGRVMAGVALHEHPGSQPKRAGSKQRVTRPAEVNFVFSGVLTDPVSTLLDQAPRLCEGLGEPVSVRVSLQEHGNYVTCKLSLLENNAKDDAQDCAMHKFAECSLEGVTFIIFLACV